MSEDLFVTSTGQVGIGTTSPELYAPWSKMVIKTDDPVDGDGLTIIGGLGALTAVVDPAPRPDGLRGWAIGGTNGHVYFAGYGGVGVGGASDKGPGVEGISADAMYPGVMGWGQPSDSSVGVRGYHYRSTGIGAGVEGLTDSTSSRAVGVLGEVTSLHPGSYSTGVRGLNSSIDGRGIGVEGDQFGTGWGVYGWVQGAGRGVYGKTNGGGFGVYSGGNLGATGTKSFIQPHPTDPAKEIRFVCLEGNESGTYFRGRARLVNGRAIIDVPEEFRLVSDAEDLTVLTTPVGARTELWVESLDLQRVVVRGDHDVEFSYMVNGIRRGFTAYEPFHENTGFVPEVRGKPFGTQYPDELRDILVENGTLNADYTPNEGTAARLGWTLSDPEPVEQDPARAVRTGDGR